jgi:ATP-binding cassette subfamily B protein
MGADLSNHAYKSTLYQPYAVHVSRNSSDMISAITGKVNTVIAGVIVPSVAIINTAIMLTMIIVALLWVNPVIAISAFLGFGVMYWVIIRLTRHQLRVDSEHIARESTHTIKALQEGLGGIRDVLIDGSQPVYCDVYQKADAALRRAQGNNMFVGQSPRYAMEAMGIAFIAFLAYSLALSESGIAGAIPVLGALALGAQRLLPVLQQGYASWSSIVGSQSSLADALDLLEQQMPDVSVHTANHALAFNRQIELKDVSFRYRDDAPWVLHDINLVIKKGSRVGFVGTTGSGKSTLLDIVMGLLYPTQGCMLVDGQVVDVNNMRGWQQHIAHVPQSIYLSDASVAENIAFGIPKDNIDYARVKVAAEQAQIADVIEGLAKDYNTLVGERGVRLSGGQRQRIGIARALYKQASVIIFDEATSALDNETEQAVMESIDNLSSDLTVLIIAHRLSTLKNVDHIVELKNGLLLLKDNVNG